MNVCWNSCAKLYKIPLNCTLPAGVTLGTWFLGKYEFVIGLTLGSWKYPKQVWIPLHPLLQFPNSNSECVIDFPPTHQGPTHRQTVSSSAVIPAVYYSKTGKRMHVLKSLMNKICNPFVTREKSNYSLVLPRRCTTADPPATTGSTANCLN